MCDEPKRKPVAKAVAEALGRELSSSEIEECVEFELDMKTVMRFPLRKMLRPSFAFLPIEHAHGTWAEGVTLLSFPKEELGGVMLGGHYYAAKTETSFYKRRMSVSGKAYKPGIRAIKRTMQ